MNELAFQTDDLATIRAIGERKGRQALFERRVPEVLEELQTIASIESTESSNRLEGIITTSKRTKSLVLHSTEPKNRNEQEIAGYRDALSLVHQAFSDNDDAMAVSENVIRQLHQTVYRYLPQDGGQWKSVDNDIVERDRAGAVTRVRFRTLSAVETPSAMSRFQDLFQLAEREREPLVFVPLSILDFLCIHPFADGNGRVGRLLTLAALYRHGYRVGRYISLERIFEETKTSYYETLESSSIGWHNGTHNPFPWIRYFWGVLLSAYDQFEQRVDGIGEGVTKTERIKRTVNRYITPFSISDVERDCPGVSRDMIRVVLRELRDLGQLEVVGAGRGAKWRKLT